MKTNKKNGNILTDIQYISSQETYQKALGDKEPDHGAGE